MSYVKQETDYDTSPTSVLLETTKWDSSRDIIISDSDLAISQWVSYTFVCQMIDIFGTMTNIINIICFIKQGFKDPVNVSLLGLAVSDLGCLIPLIWTNICLTPAVIAADLPFDPVEFQYLTGGWPHVTFTRVSAWMTALITLERCLCVTAPLQVKNVITSKRITIITICIFTILITSVAPVYVVSGYSFKLYPARNRTLLGLVFTENRDLVESISYAINNIFVSFSAFFVIVVCTLILVFKLNINTKWRASTAKTTQADKVSGRNKKASKMVVMISILFIACFIPIVIVFVTMTIEPKISIRGKYRNLGFLLGGFCVILESVNSSVNIFIYYYMSSKYRTALRQLLCTKD